MDIDPRDAQNMATCRKETGRKVNVAAKPGHTAVKNDDDNDDDDVGDGCDDVDHDNNDDDYMHNISIVAPLISS